MSPRPARLPRNIRFSRRPCRRERINWSTPTPTPPPGAADILSLPAARSPAPRSRPSANKAATAETLPLDIGARLRHHPDQSRWLLSLCVATYDRRRESGLCHAQRIHVPRRRVFPIISYAFPVGVTPLPVRGVGEFFRRSQLQLLSHHRPHQYLLPGHLHRNAGQPWIDRPRAIVYVQRADQEFHGRQCRNAKFF